MTESTTPPRRWPRWSLATLSFVHAVVLGACAAVLPWADWTVFAGLTGGLAVGHLLVASLALMRRPVGLHRAWWAVSWAAIAWFAYVLWAVISSAVWIAAIYGGVGQGVAAALGLVVAPAALFSVPMAVWGLTATRRWGRPESIGSSAVAVLFGLGLISTHLAASAQPIPQPGELGLLVASLAGEPATTPLRVQAATCSQGLDVATLLVSWPAQHGPSTRCIQGDIPAALASLNLPTPIAIDVARAAAPIESQSALLSALAVRPGLDGVCLGDRCLAPWQLLADNVFTTHTPLAFIPDMRIGSDPERLRALLGGGEGPLIRLETRSYVLDQNGLLPLSRLHREHVDVDADSVATAARQAETHILRAQAKDGHFRYWVEPFSGKRETHAFTLPRQAGTTLVLCEAAGAAADEPIARSLDFVARFAKRHGDVAMLQRGGDRGVPGLGHTALPAIAFLACRDRVGTQHDALIGQMGRALMRQLRPDGDFAPGLSVEDGEPSDGPTPLYAGGQAIYALVLLEALAANEPDGPFPPASELRAAVDRAMDYAAGPYWGHALRDFFFIEENWHCLAARAALAHHRHDGYERLCLDYVDYKKRLILDAESEVADDLIGGYGFGNVIPPHVTPTAGFGEALAAAMAVRRARAAPDPTDLQRMRLALGFLLAQQWDARTCFACKHPKDVIGSWSESPSSMISRIDYTQHALAALAHGGRELGLLQRGPGGTRRAKADLPFDPAPMTIVDLKGLGAHIAAPRNLSRVGRGAQVWFTAEGFPTVTLRRIANPSGDPGDFFESSSAKVTRRFATASQAWTCECGPPGQHKALIETLCRSLTPKAQEGR